MMKLLAFYTSPIWLALICWQLTERFAPDPLTKDLRRAVVVIEDVENDQYGLMDDALYRAFSEVAKTTYTSRTLPVGVKPDVTVKVTNVKWEQDSVFVNYVVMGVRIGSQSYASARQQDIAEIEGLTRKEKFMNRLATLITYAASSVID